MNRRITGVVGVAAALGLAATALPGNAHAVPGTKDLRDLKRTQPAIKPDNRPDALQRHQSALRQKAVDDLIAGKATTVGKGSQRTIRMSDGTKVDYPVNQTAQLLTFLVDFGDSADGVGHEGNPSFPENTAGPVHNEIPEPDRDGGDNTTYWEPDFSTEHYKEMFFTGLPDQNGESFHNVYKEMSSGRFDLQGDVSDWVSVPHPESYYQDDDGGETGSSMTNFIGDSATAWYDAQIAANKTPQQIKDYLATFDQWDRNDYDGDGNYNEPDGYIDHFQAIHAGEGEEAGADPWTIWSHRAAADPYAKTGPAKNPVGGVEIGDTGFWIRDYTTEPENGGLGVFAHEFGHDLGLPDFYDTQGGDNGTGFWTLMSSGSWSGHGDGTIGTTPSHMAANEKLFLGWYGTTGLQNSADLRIVPSGGDPQTVTLGPSYHATDIGAQALAVSLPEGSAKVTVVPPDQGTHYFYSGNGDDRTATLTSPQFTVPSASPRLTARVSYSLEDDYDYSFVKVSTDGLNWDNIETNRSTTDDTNGANPGFGITGCSGDRDDSGACDNAWVDLTADLSAYAGKQVYLRFETDNDAGYHELGLAIDQITVGDALHTDVEDGAPGWTLKKYTVMNGSSFTKTYQQYYIAENRQYQGYDTTLAEGPYSWDYSETAPLKVDQFPYQDGLLVWYANGLYDDNNTSAHPGGGQALPVDANPEFQLWTQNGQPYDIPDGRLNTFDATFDVDQNPGLHLTSETGEADPAHFDVPAGPSVSVFDDSDPDAYWDDNWTAKGWTSGWYSTKVAGSGTSITVLTDDKSNGRMTVRVASVAPRATVAPRITGTPRVGSRLTATSGTWTLAPSLSYQWLANGAPIAGATGSSYTLKPAQSGKTITVRLTATKTGHPTGSATSSATGKVLPAAVGLSVKAPRSVKKRKKVAITVTASTVGLVPTGRVQVRFDGRKVVKTLSGGRATVRLTAKHRGRKKVVVTYLPTAGFTGATRTVTVKVK